MKENKEIEKFVESLSEDFNLSDKGEQTIREVFARVHNNALKMVGKIGKWNPIQWNEQSLSEMKKDIINLIKEK